MKIVGVGLVPTPTGNPPGVSATYKPAIFTGILIQPPAAPQRMKIFIGATKQAQRCFVSKQSFEAPNYLQGS
jgi:hypothetical protein